MVLVGEKVSQPADVGPRHFRHLQQEGVRECLHGLADHKQSIQHGIEEEIRFVRIYRFVEFDFRGDDALDCIFDVVDSFIR